ncbi:MAG TPA: hypothetical protein V6C84_26455 [Coleofasciculaceae cyanobacterium]
MFRALRRTPGDSSNALPIASEKIATEKSAFGSEPELESCDRLR